MSIRSDQRACEPSRLALEEVSPRRRRRRVAVIAKSACTATGTPRRKFPYLVESLYRLMNVVAYLRVSTDRQAEEGLGLDVQKHAIRAWAKQHGNRIVAWARDEGVSGSN